MRYLSILLLGYVQFGFSCTDIFINKTPFHITARTLDFPLKLYTQSFETYSWYQKIFQTDINLTHITSRAFSFYTGYLDVENTTNLIANRDKVPEDNLAHWQNKYGFFGRLGFIGYTLTDGLNTEGVSIAALYLPGSVYPKYNPHDPRPALGIYDLSNFILGMANSTQDALKLIMQYQLVESAMYATSGLYIKDIPLHIVIRDKTGHSAVIEFIDGKTVIYDHATNVLTNAPDYEWQIKNLTHYKTLSDKDAKASLPFAHFIPDYKTVIKYAQPEDAGLLGMPGDYTSVSRFVRASILTRESPTPQNTNQALYQAKTILSSVTVPYYEATATLWQSIKDLDNKRIYYRDLLYYDRDRIKQNTLNNGFVEYDLTKMDFTAHTPEQLNSGLKITPVGQISGVLSINDIPGLNDAKNLGFN
ncbi:linear amide C-N hydrolase [Cysteiniphilum litorale]|uniref:linear amide C-N hydrolase n=1 Tax=Cysteiniphilum litorale TaxID=2056700 RepID=UPI003F88299B